MFLGRDYQTQLNYSDEMAAKIDGEIKSILDTQYQNALSVLRANRDIMDKMVKLLYEKETIYENEIDALFEGASLEEILKASDGGKTYAEKKAPRCFGTSRDPRRGGQGERALKVLRGK